MIDRDSVRVWEHENRATVVAILQDVRSAEHSKNDLAVLVAGGDWPSQLWMPPENVSPDNQLVRHVCGEVGELLVEQRRESIEVGEGVERPLDVYWPGHGRKPNSRTTVPARGPTARDSTQCGFRLTFMFLHCRN